MEPTLDGRMRARHRALVAVCAGQLYLGFKNRGTAGHLLASAFPGGEKSTSALARLSRRSGGGKNTVLLRLGLGDEGAEAEVAELADENRAFDWGPKCQSQADAGT
jgi:hypothetical protein